MVAAVAVAVRPKGDEAASEAVDDALRCEISCQLMDSLSITLIDICDVLWKAGLTVVVR